MGRIANFFGKATPILGGIYDYQQNKAAGNDDIHAVASSAGSTAGGWAGGEAGAMGGAAIGTAILPGIGTVIGGGIGGIGGAIAGSGVGSWLLGGADELIRGKQGTKQMQHYDRNGNFIGDDGNPEPDIAQSAANVAAGGGALYAGGQLIKNVAQSGYNPVQGYQHYAGNGAGVGTALKETAKDAGYFIKNAASRMGPLAKGVGIAGSLYLADQILGKPVEKLIDTVSGQRTNFDNDPENARKQQQLRQMQNDTDMQRRQQEMSMPTQQQNDSALAGMYSDPNYRFVKQEGLEAQKRQQDNEQKIFNRDRNAQLQNSRYSLAAQNSRDIMSAWSDSARNVNSAMQTISNARF